MLTPMRAVFVGDGSLVVRCAEAFARAGHVVVRVASADPQVLAWAQDEGLPSEQASEVPRFEGDDFDWLFSIGWLHRLPPPLLARAHRLALNFHDGPLPRHGGLNAPAWALLEGCRHHGVTWHEMTPALDAGRIACELSFDLSPDETAFSLATHCHEAGYQSFLTLLAQIAQGTLALRTPAGAPRLHGRHQRPAALGTLDWRRPAADLAATVRALDFGPLPNPLACAKVLCEGRLLRVGSAQEVTRREWDGVPHEVDPHHRDSLGTDLGDEASRERAYPADPEPSAWRPAEPGTVLAVREGALWLATGRGVIRLEGLQAIDGGPLPALTVGARLDALSPSTLQRLAQARPALARAEGAWRPRLIALAQAQLAQLPHPRLHPASASPPQPFEVVLPVQAPLLGGLPHDWLAACAAWLAAVSGEPAVGLRWRDPVLARASEGLSPFACGWWPLLLELAPGQGASDLREMARGLLAQAQADGPVSADLRWRLGRLAPAHPVFGVCVGDAPQGPAFDAPEICLMVPAGAARGDGGPVPWRLQFDARLWPAEVACEIAAQLASWMHRFPGNEGALSQLSLLPAQDEARLQALNDTAMPVDLPGGAWQAVARGLACQAHEVALEWEGGCLDRAGLLAQVQALAADLRRRGLAPGEVVGVCLPRGPALVVSVLAVLACGGAYLPLDPHYPAERLRFMCRDAGLRRVLGGAGVADLLGLPPDTVIAPQPSEGVPQDPMPETDAPLPGDLAYLIYTSGSTGQPKGVQVTHGGVLNFFAGMDRVLAPKAEAPGRWLAVTSLSFDISVLELLWTLARGYMVVIHDAAAPAPAVIPSTSTTPRPEAATQFSLFYFASEDGGTSQGQEGGEGGASREGGEAPALTGRDAYRLLLEGARFADRHGFAAVWTPERHFHGFGGPFPNPALAAAALAMVTRHVQLRAGSCVLPLHHPLSVAEDWALVDRLSGGRVGVSFAAGWQPQDFVLAPQAWAGRREQLFAGIDAVRRLWRGEAMDWPGPEGRTVSVRTLPRPVQPELPVWVTAAGNPETFAEAGRAGCHLLTHLLGQSAQDLAPKIAAYRAAWQAAGHPGRGQVALMLHALVGDDEDAMREAARGPLKAYLRSAMDLIRRADWRFPTFAPSGAEPGAATGAIPGAIPGALTDLADRPPTDEETEALLEHAFERYWRGSALIGSPARCLALVDALRAQGVDEIACLIDFGVDASQALAHLPDLHRLMRLAQRETRQHAPPVRPVLPVAARALSVASAIRRAGITHLQCTPSQAAILLADEPGRQALSQLEVLLVGGEALPPAMARALRARVPGQVLNMYGPTEATVWCSAWPLPARGPGAGEEAVSLGRPLANVTLHLRNAWGQECPAYVPGELCVGGAGLARGYHARPELNAQRFIDDPLCAGRRLYRTGDQVRRLPDGTLAFLGRLDHQVKIRGHRIELGEIEAVLAREEGVREAVVVACQGGAGEGWLQAFVTARPGQLPQPLDLSRALARQLPEFMLPRGIALRDRLPLTPNGKVDRQALAASGEARPPHLSQSARSPRPLRAVAELDSETGFAPADTSTETNAETNAETNVAPSVETSVETGATLRRLEALVGGIWRGVLARQDVGREANFFDMGGHSLAVLQVQRRLREATGIEIAITDMFRLTTVAAQARYLAGQQASAQRLFAPAASAASAPVLEGVPLPGPAGPLPISLGQGRAQARRALRTPLPG